MCSSCDSDRRAITSNLQKIRNNSARIKDLREDKKRRAESLTKSIKSAKSPSSKASFRNAKTRSNLSFDQRIESIRRDSEKLRKSNASRRASIKSRGKHKR